MNNPKRNHHITPKLYLKGFTIENGRRFLWVYKRGLPYNPGDAKSTNNPSRQSISTAGVERDFYADPKENGSQDFEGFENKLESLEKPADTILQKLRARQMINQKEKCLFSCYIMQMHRRVQAGRERVRKLLTERGYGPSGELLRQMNLPDTHETHAMLKGIMDSWTQREGSDIQVHNRVTAAAEDSILIKVLENMVWSFYTAPKRHAFLTSDDPVFISKQFGLGKNVSELSFPISADVALVASWSQFLKEGFSETTPQVLKELNRRTVTQASLYVYFSENCEWITRMLERGRYDYHPIYSVKRVYDVARLENSETEPRLVWC